jgi:hypothetical protein
LNRQAAETIGRLQEQINGMFGVGVGPKPGKSPIIGYATLGAEDVFRGNYFLRITTSRDGAGDVLSERANASEHLYRGLYIQPGTYEIWNRDIPQPRWGWRDADFLVHVEWDAGAEAAARKKYFNRVLAPWVYGGLAVFGLGVATLGLKETLILGAILGGVALWVAITG